MRVRADELRAAMVDGLVAAGRIRTPEIERAFRRVPRHTFLPDTSLEQAYQDEAVATKWQHGVPISSASQPSMMAIMLEQLELRPGHRVLEIGTGTGYNAALMADLVGPAGSLVAVDIDDDLTRGAAEHLAAAGVPGVTLATRDGALGYPELAPYHRIVLTVGSWDVQPAWWRQLAPAGRLLLPLTVHGSQLSVALDLSDGPVGNPVDGPVSSPVDSPPAGPASSPASSPVETAPLLRSVSVRSCAFVRLRGQGAGPQTSRPLADGLALQAAADLVVDPVTVLRLLDQPGPAHPTSVRLRPIDLWDGLGLWLAVHEPGACRFLVSAANERHRALGLLPAGADGGTMGLVGDAGLAVLGTPDIETGTGHPVAVRPYGPDGERYADRLGEAVRRWTTAGQPTAAELRLRVHPGAATGAPAPGAARLVKDHSWLELTWPRDLSDEPTGEIPGGSGAVASKLAR